MEMGSQMVDSVTLENARPGEVRVSPDGTRIYSGGADGFLRVYDGSSGDLIDAWRIGQSLGGLDISPDGSFLMVVDTGVSRVYRVDALSGESTSYSYSQGYYEGLLFDVAILDNGTALFSRNFNGSGFTGSEILDLQSGTFSDGPRINQSSTLSRSPTGETVLITEPNSSGGPVDIYRADVGITAQSFASGYNRGVQAFNGDLAATYVYNIGVTIYDSSLNKIVTLTSWNYGAVGDLAFSPDGEWLYILDQDDNTIVKVDTDTWLVADTIETGLDIGSYSGSWSVGTRLIVDPQERYFSVVTDSSFALVENPDAPEISGTYNSDELAGALFSDDIFGLAGDDTIAGDRGDDALHGGNGEDLLAGGLGDDLLDGGNGRDTASYFDAGSAVIVSLAIEGAQDTVGDGTDTLVSIENLEGSAHADDLTGSGLVNSIHGLAGDDAIFGLGAGDTLAGGDGADTVFGGNGYDSLSGDTGDDTLNGGFGNDTLWGGSGDDALYGNANDDLLRGGAGRDRLYGGYGADELRGGSDDDELYGAYGSDTLYGGFGFDLLDGGSGSDILFGGNGADILKGSYGKDILTGGAGADGFLFEHLRESGRFAVGADTITDFRQADNDIIRIGNIDADIATAANDRFAFIGTDTFSGTAGELRYYFDGSGDTVILMDVDGDYVSDMAIRLTGEIALEADDFVGVDAASAFEGSGKSGSAALPFASLDLSPELAIVGGDFAF